MNLEVVARIGANARRRPRPPLLFIHGICHGAWCWEEHFLDYFAEHGWNAFALSLRGHQLGSVANNVSGCRIADYVADVRSVAQSLADPPVLIGHSMGGFIVQKYLEQSDAPATVLLASMPPRGGFRSPLLRQEALLIAASIARRNLVQAFATPQRCRRAFFSASTPEETVYRCTQRLTEESTKAVIDMLIADRPGRRNIPSVPMLVLGASDDAIFCPAQVRLTAAHYAATATFIGDAGHNMMLEANWSITAQHIETWLAELTAPGLSSRSEKSFGVGSTRSSSHRTDG